MQELVTNAAKTAKPSDLSSLTKSFCELELLKLRMKMKPAPKPVDTLKMTKAQKHTVESFTEN